MNLNNVMCVGEDLREYLNLMNILLYIGKVEYVKSLLNNGDNEELSII
jgi:hypothetical protein